MASFPEANIWISTYGNRCQMLNLALTQQTKPSISAVDFAQQS
jgi:hypothetical protein